MASYTKEGGQPTLDMESMEREMRNIYEELKQGEGTTKEATDLEASSLAKSSRSATQLLAQIMGDLGPMLKDPMMQNHPLLAKYLAETSATEGPDKESVEEPAQTRCDTSAEVDQKNDKNEAEKTEKSSVGGEVQIEAAPTASPPEQGKEDVEVDKLIHLFVSGKKEKEKAISAERPNSESRKSTEEVEPKDTITDVAVASSGSAILSEAKAEMATGGEVNVLKKQEEVATTGSPGRGSRIARDSTRKDTPPRKSRNPEMDKEMERIRRAVEAKKAQRQRELLSQSARKESVTENTADDAVAKPKEATATGHTSASLGGSQTPPRAASSDSVPTALHFHEAPVAVPLPTPSDDPAPVPAAASSPLSRSDPRPAAGPVQLGTLPLMRSISVKAVTMPAPIMAVPVPVPMPVPVPVEENLSEKVDSAGENGSDGGSSVGKHNTEEAGGRVGRSKADTASALWVRAAAPRVKDRGDHHRKQLLDRRITIKPSSSLDKGSLVASKEGTSGGVATTVLTDKEAKAKNEEIEDKQSSDEEEEEEEEDEEEERDKEEEEASEYEEGGSEDETMKKLMKKGSGELDEKRRALAKSSGDVPLRPNLDSNGSGEDDAAASLSAFVNSPRPSPSTPTRNVNEQQKDDSGAKRGEESGGVKFSRFGSASLVSAKRTYKLNEGNNTLGRGDVQIVLKAASVSRKHAVITLKNGTAFIRDLNSTHGTRVNDKLVSGKTPLAVGDSIKLGSIRVTFQVEPPIMEGVLAKRSPAFHKSWQKRYCVLKKRQRDIIKLYYYRSKENKLPQGSVSMEQVVSVTDDESGVSTNVLKIKTIMRVFEFQAKDEEERNMWIRALREASGKTAHRLEADRKERQRAVVASETDTSDAVTASCEEERDARVVDKAAVPAEGSSLSSSLSSSEEDRSPSEIIKKRINNLDAMF